MHSYFLPRGNSAWQAVSGVVARKLDFGLSLEWFRTFRVSGHRM